jgi:ferrochelatase
MKMRFGVLLLNFGGPSSLRDVQPFLRSLFNDPAILNLPWPIRPLVAEVISRLRAPRSARMYRAIGGGSPLLRWTRAQAAQVEVLLQADGLDVRVACGMKASPPSIADGLEELRTSGVEKIVLLPLFPQYSQSTVGACLREAKAALSKMKARDRYAPELVEIESWCEEPSYIALLRSYVDRARQGNPDAHVLFSAHSLPQSMIDRGDPYLEEVRRTVLAVTRAGAPFGWSLAFQSRGGPMRWLEPELKKQIRNLVLDDVTSIVLCPISFVSDHLETLWELDQEVRAFARDQGVDLFVRVPMFNDDPAFARVLQTIVSVFNKAPPRILRKTHQ